MRYWVDGKASPGRSKVPRPVSRRAFLGGSFAIGGGLLLPTLAGCSSDSPTTLKIAYQQWGSGTTIKNFLAKMAEQFAAIRPEVKIEPLPIVASEGDYFTKNELIMSNKATTPDLIFEDTFILKSDVAAGYLRPMDDLLAEWEPWADVFDSAKPAVTGEDGKTYGIPVGTDSRALWYNAEILAAAGIALPWKPRNWNELLRDLRTIKQKQPDVIPFNIYSGTPQGEKASMQGFEMLLYGTGGTLFDEDEKKWVVGSQEFQDSLEMVRVIFAEKLGPSLENALDPNISGLIYSDWIPQGKLAVNMDGSWISLYWADGAADEWPEWNEKIQVTPMPTQNGQPPGYTTISGGWCLALPARSDKAELAWEFLQLMLSTDNLTDYNIADNGITVRADIAKQEAYQSYSPTVGFFTGLVEEANFRPAFAAYPQVSAAIQIAMEEVMMGTATAEEAAKAYDDRVESIVGAGSVTRRAAS